MRWVAKGSEGSRVVWHEALQSIECNNSTVHACAECALCAPFQNIAPCFHRFTACLALIQVLSNANALQRFCWSCSPPHLSCRALKCALHVTLLCLTHARAGLQVSQLQGDFSRLSASPVKPDTSP